MAQPITIGSAGGEYMDSVVVLEWNVKLGDHVKAGDLLVTVETAKAATEVQSPTDGILSAIYAQTGTEIALTEVLGLVGSSLDDVALDQSQVHVPEAPTHIAQETPFPSPSPAVQSTARAGRIIASPAARRVAQQIGTDLRTVSASSPTGRIKLRDLPQEKRLDPVMNLLKDQTGPLKVYNSGRGSGVPVILLHGFASDASSWYRLEQELGKEWPVVRIELPNHGQSPKRRIEDFKILAREIVEAFDATNLELAHFVGHSLGAACALALTDVRPKRVASLSLLAPAGLGPSINSDFVHGIALASRPESLEQWLKLMVWDRRLIGRDFVGAAMASRADATLRAAQQQMAQDIFADGAQNFDLRAALGRVACPSRIIWGKRDSIIPWKHALEAPGNVALHLFDDVGHVPHFEIPEIVREILVAAFIGTEART